MERQTITMKRLVNSKNVLLLIANLVLAASTHSENPTTATESSEIQINGQEMSDNKYDGEERMSVNDQISLVSRQLNMLTERRQEDYRMLERSLHSYVQKHLEQYLNVDIKRELKDLRWAIDYTGTWNGIRVFIKKDEISKKHIFVVLYIVGI